MSGVSFTPRDADSHPPFIDPDYKSTGLRGPTKPLIPLKHSASETTGPLYGHEAVSGLDNDLTRNGVKNGEVIGERINVAGQVLDELGRPVANSLVEVWQCNAAGRYIDDNDRHDAPLDPNFYGGGRCVTDENGVYRFRTIRPAAYPWGNHPNAWRPGHIHFSLFGAGLASRLITQMYFPGDPLIRHDPIAQATPSEAIDRLIARFSLEETEPDTALGFVFDIVLRGPKETPMENRP
ncbi:MAG: protocatechuate 3,4-dioxygenase subunit beta [Minwuia sp.]|uniref:protocatechuate 3,4-dioxygenase subunit beta n=1 Tax=Minwuia sp. TaxID=2493630 RepID=UPI003A84F097